jgi:hypothetical protein
MNLVEPFETHSMSPHPSTSVALSFFVSSCITGWYIYYLYKKSDITEKRLDATIEKVRDILDIQDLQTESVEEVNTRLREKKDYDDSEEVEEGKYQAWKGTYSSDPMQFTVVISREKESTVKKNQEWTAWDGTQDGSCTVRDFYLGNSHPDFSWAMKPTVDAMCDASVSDTLINGWDSVITISMTLVTTKENLLDFISSQSYSGSPTFNAALKKLVDTNCIEWSRALVDA